MIEATELSPGFGAELGGVDLARPVDAATAEDLRRSLWRHKVIRIRGQNPTPDQYLAFAQAFGELEPFFIGSYNLESHPQIYVLSNVRRDGVAIGRDGAGTHWHSDSTFVERPSSITFLHAVAVPEQGGDTLFIDTVAAYERLDDATKALIDGRRAVHRYQKKEFILSGERDLPAEERAEIERLQRLRAEEDREAPPSATAKRANTEPDRLQPIARTHPITGKKALYLNDEMCVGIDGMTEPDGMALLRRLCHEATAPEHILRYEWKMGDIVAWDNAATIHTATFTRPEEARIMHRLTVKGDVPF
ncbi:MAG: TauD/TfdA family dioxygenase [Rhodospirillaceae bacterium]|jgi:taurine dioxygenase|nr:TauD/TfdA family dioxygenase [Rhodospirillaceae bacterium]MBT6136916.1 TauD/TfdA family dioxygenase [Rhodospirillaceae bacterium]